MHPVCVNMSEYPVTGYVLFPNNNKLKMLLSELSCASVVPNQRGISTL